MGVQIYGRQTARRFDSTDPTLEGLDLIAIVFGLRELTSNKGKFLGMNKDKILVFVTSEKAIVSCYEMGFRRTILVHALNNLSVADVQFAMENTLGDLEESYSFYKLAAISGDLGGVMDAVKGITELIVSIKNKDPQKCMQVLAKTGPVLIENAEAIRRLIELSSHLLRIDKLGQQIAALQAKIRAQSSGSGVSAEELTALSNESKKLTDQLAESIAETKRLKETNESLQTEIISCKQRVNEIQDANNTQYSEFAQILETVQNSLTQKNEECERQETKLAALQTMVDGLNANLQECRDQYYDVSTKYNDLVLNSGALTQKYQENVEELARLKAVDADINSNTVIQRLKLQLAESSKMTTSNERIRSMMPIIGNSFAIRAGNVAVFRELKRAPYMNTFLEYMDSNATSAFTRRLGKSFIILVLDLMLNDYEIFKYKKHSFNINQGPAVHADGKRKNVCVINQFDVEFLKSTMRLVDYDYIFVIDRLGLTVPSVKLPNMTEFFMINSLSDVSDFDLRGRNLILYGESAKTQATISIPPQPDLFDSISDNRNFGLHKYKVFEAIMEKVGR